MFNSNERKRVSSPGLLVYLVLISSGLMASAFTGPFPERALVYSLSTLSAIFCGALMLVSFRKEDFIELFQSKTFQLLLATFICVWCSISLYRYLSQQLFPFLHKIEHLDQAANGGLYDLLFQKHFSTLAMRNGSPFGHPNYNSGFLLILLPLLTYGIVFPASKGCRWLSGIALLFGLGILVSTQSRNALLGVGVAVGMGVWWNQLQRKRALQILGGLAVLGMLLLAIFPRFQQMLTSVSPARRGMWQAAWMTGKHYFPFGSGEGLTPEMLQLFSPNLTAIWENSIQFHHTWLHLWAVGGILAGFGILGSTVWIFIRLLFPGEMDPKIRLLVTPSVMALSASFIVFWADYQMDIFPIALLLFFHLGVLAVCTGKDPSSSTRFQQHSKGLLIVPAICLLISAWMIPASLQSRREIEQAGSAYEEGDIPTAVKNYLQAFDTLPESYSLNMAAVLLSQNPAGHAEAIKLFERSLELWEPQTLVHEYLVFLWMQEADEHTDPEDRKEFMEKALHHARRRAEIAPQLRGSYLDIAMISQQLSLPDEDITEALFYELVMQGDLVFPVTWTALGELEVYREPVLRQLMTSPPPVNPQLRSRIERLQGYADLIGDFPSGIEGSDPARERIANRMDSSAAFVLLQNICDADPTQKVEAMKRLLVYLFESPISDESTRQFLPAQRENCIGDVLTFGQPRAKRTGFKGVGITARHPYSIPVNRPRAYPDVFGSRFVPAVSHKAFRLEEPKE